MLLLEQLLSFSLLRSQKFDDGGRAAARNLRAFGSSDKQFLSTYSHTTAYARMSPITFDGCSLISCSVVLLMVVL